MIVSAGQSFLDLAIQLNGNLLSAVDLAEFNQMNVTDEIAPRTAINEVETNFTNNDVKQFFQVNSRKIATAFIPEFNIDEDYEFPQGELPISL